MSMNGGGISIWEPNKAYEVDAVVIDSNLIWQCATAHTSTSTFDKSKWVCLSGTGIAVWQPNTDYEVQNVVIYNYALYICSEAHTSATDFEYDKWIPMSGTGSSSDPIGTVISYMGNTPPSDYLACDGTIYNIADYQDLADHINTQFGSYNYFGGNGTTTFAVPDLRGEFLRGTGTNSHANQGSGAAVGTHQDGTDHLWDYVSTSGKFGFRNETQSDSSAKNVDSILSSQNNVKYTDYAGTWKNSSGSDYAYTSRPTNTSVLYCIRYKNSGIEYSTEEKRVGTWIDGKPLYQKTYICNVQIPYNSWTTTTLDAPVNIGRIISSEAISDISSMNYISCTFDSGYIKMLNLCNMTISVKCLTLKYTKTTD
jgi:microcystin-dependent protein